MKILTWTIMLVLAVLILGACTARQPAVYDRGGVPGFWLGLWHGFISPLAFIVGLFVRRIEIYAFPNTGGWYDFGFMLGIGGFSGGIFAQSKRKK